ncbi:MAG TPA: polysaccharide deacetylase family protein [Candidatus Acidoferrum sp.]|nr:polysaccharide deacetylase family protein [Candidatus Acidoferrum sp.]
MKNGFRRIAAVCGLSMLPWCALSRGQTTAETSIVRQADAIVSNYRKIIVLMDGSSALDPGVRERSSIAGKILFQENQELLEKLDGELTNALSEGKGAVAAEFLDRLESDSFYRDADKLAFRETLEDLGAVQGAVNDKLATRIRGDQKALVEIQGLYQREIGEILEGLQTRGMVVHREAWEHYVSFVRQKYTREEILKAIEGQLPPAESRGAGAKKPASGQVFGNDLPPKTLVLTFDDGPHPRYTDQILEILKKYGLKAVFFEVGRNLGPETTDPGAKLATTAAVSQRILAQGSTIGNHSYSHPVLSKMPEAGYTKEIETTNALLTAVLKEPPVLFRPPYGATNAAIVAKVQADKMKSILWNVDSEDWADPVPNSIARRVVQEVEKNGRGIILFHDIHKITIEVLPMVIETLEKDGYKFTSWNGSGFGPEATRGLDTATQTPAPTMTPYRESWAAVIGIDVYQTWPTLSYAANDAQAVRDMLLKKYNFKDDHVFLLLDKQATRQNMLSLLGDKLANPDLVKREDRVFVFFAGHGATRHLASGRDLGYIIPVDADLTNYEGQAISMSNFQDIAEGIPAKHLLFVMDSCYSGLALTRGAGGLPMGNYLLEISRRTARQMFTAGGADQQVADNGPNGHSIFTWTLLQALDGRADLNGDGVITGTELAAYVTPAVSALSHQTPAFGNLPGSEGGDFIFELSHETEFLNENSAQLNEDAIKANTELEKLKGQIQEQAAQNEELKKQLAAAEAQLQQERLSGQTAGTKLTGTVPVEANAKDVPAATNDEGMRLYKEKKYAEASAKFKEASQLQPGSALFANNAGFACFKLGQYEEAVQWFQKAIAADPNRSVAYLNLGDAYLQLGKKPEAKQAFLKYLELQPNSKAAPGVQEKLKNL